MHRRDRTRHLIELGGLVQKAGLADLTDDDRATILGGLLGLADTLQGEGGAALREVFRRRGLRAFEADAVAAE
ncbi:MAG: conjugal transfer protein TraD [Phenylobacterium sp.]|nr:conjugal transfer protein TraD [Phenylobacterium sp.]